MATLRDCQVVKLPKVHSRSGNLTAIEPGINYPIEIKRVFYLYDVPSGSDRGGHAHKTLFQLLIAASGSFEIVLDDGREHQTFFLNRPDRGLLVTPGIWGELQEFSAGAICLVMASDVYLEEDYLRDMDNFRRFKQ